MSDLQNRRYKEISPEETVKKLKNRLKELEIGDKIYLTSKNGIKKEYDIYDIFKVYPNDTKCLSQKTNGNVELTLITCTLDSEKRIIVKAREYEE